MKRILLTFLVLFCLLLSENGISQNQWERKFITIYNNIAKGNLLLTFEFFDFEFGPSKEHAYLEWCDFEFSTDGLNYKTLAKCEVSNQAFSEQVWVNMTHKLEGSTIEFYGYYLEKIISTWLGSTNQWVPVTCLNNKGILALKWYVASNFQIKNFRVTGKWQVIGFNCPNYINGEIYTVPEPAPITPDGRAKSMQNNNLDQPENTTVKVTKDAYSVRIKGAALGESICVYSTSGMLVRSVVADKDLMNIKLPASQMYYVKAGQERFKIAL